MRSMSFKVAEVEFCDGLAKMECESPRIAIQALPQLRQTPYIACLGASHPVAQDSFHLISENLAEQKMHIIKSSPSQPDTK